MANWNLGPKSLNICKRLWQHDICYLKFLKKLKIFLWCGKFKIFFNYVKFLNFPIQYFSSKCNSLIFCIKFKQIYLLKDSLKSKKIIKIILQQLGFTIVKNIFLNRLNDFLSDHIECGKIFNAFHLEDQIKDKIFNLV